MPESKNKNLVLEENARLKLAIESLKAVQQEKEYLQKSYNDSQLRFRTIFEESSMGKKIIDKDLEIIKVNKMLLKILGYSKSDLIGKKITQFTHPDFIVKWEKLRRELWLVSDPRTSFSIDTCLIRKDQSVVWCRVTSILFKDNEDQLGYTIFEDISDRKEKERIKDELEKRQNLLDVKIREQARQKELFETIIKAQEEERERISEQLHDGLGQLLYAIKIRLSLIKPKDIHDETVNSIILEVNRLLSDSITECRRTAHHLLPRILNDFGLRAALEDLGTQFRSAVNFTLQFDSLAPIKEKYAEIVIFRTVQELFLNIVKHAEATEASCQVAIEKKTVSIIVEDNGNGMAPDALRKKAIGLSAMKSRMLQMGGTFEIRAGSPQGTIISITIPRRKF